MYTLDTAAAIQEITEAGADPAVAQAIVAQIAQADQSVATKADLAALEVRMVEWGVGIALGTAALLFAALSLTLNS